MYHLLINFAELAVQELERDSVRAGHQHVYTPMLKYFYLDSHYYKCNISMLRLIMIILMTMSMAMMLATANAAADDDDYVDDEYEDEDVAF
jgi:hypothetical protein